MANPLSRTNTNSSSTQRLRDKTSYNMHPTPPSPSNTSPTLTQSTSNSNSTSTPSTSPPYPSTPPRTSRSRSRYGDIGRVPLHRRGTSKTYERLEDLLREAGYKETRVFTPEGERGEGDMSDRHGINPNTDQRASMRGGVEAVVGFITGLIPSAGLSRSSSILRSNQNDEQTAGPSSSFPPVAYSPPISPLAHIQSQKQKQCTPISSEPHSPTMTSSIESLEPTPRARHQRPLPRSTTPVPPNLVHSHSHRGPQRPQHQLVHRTSDQYSYTSQRSRLQNQASQTSLQQQAPAATNYGAHPPPSRAGAYLRHMASAPNMPKRPISTPAHSSGRRTFLLNDSDMEDIPVPKRSDIDSEEGQPPLPRTWLESVARAVLFGGVGAYIGGPSHLPVVVEPPSPARHAKTLRPTRSSISQASPQRNKYLRPHSQKNTKIAPSGLLAPPELFSRIERGRSGKSTGEVTLTRVVCRSAPASRANSRVRSDSKGNEDGKEKGMKSGKERARARREDGNRLPSLSTNTEDDPWERRRERSTTNVNRAGNRYLSGWGVEPDSDGDGEDDGRSSSSEEEGELDLARMLVPPKRQNSIKSLRKHLAPGDDAASSTTANLRRSASGVRAMGGMSAGGARSSRSGSVRQSIQEDDWDESEAEEWSGGWMRKAARRSSEDEEDGEAHAGFLSGDRGTRGAVLGSGRSGTGKGRLGLPGPWALIGGGS